MHSPLIIIPIHVVLPIISILANPQTVPLTLISFLHTTPTAQPPTGDCLKTPQMQHILNFGGPTHSLPRNFRVLALKVHCPWNPLNSRHSGTLSHHTENELTHICSKLSHPTYLLTPLYHLI